MIKIELTGSVKHQIEVQYIRIIAGCELPDILFPAGFTVNAFFRNFLIQTFRHDLEPAGRFGGKIGLQEKRYDVFRIRFEFGSVLFHAEVPNESFAFGRTVKALASGYEICRIKPDAGVRIRPVEHPAFADQSRFAVAVKWNSFEVILFNKIFNRSGNERNQAE